LLMTDAPVESFFLAPPRSLLSLPITHEWQ
jgi:hypothetical protein